MIKQPHKGQQGRDFIAILYRILSMILSPMFKFHLLVPAARADRGETGENRPVPGAGQWATGALGREREREGEW